MRASDPSFPAQVGRYPVVRLLGRGAMGRVFLAHDPILDRDVAIKCLRDDLALPPEHRVALLERMRQEARAAARVSHPHLIALFDMGDDPEVGLFLVFELVEGRTLKEALTRGPLPPAEVARLGRELGGALTAAHHSGVVHRDVKPENVFLSEAGAKIGDFGIARLPDSTLTREGSLIGTPAYSAPEALGDGRFSPLSDQFSLAATLWEALSGRRAFPGEDAVAVASRIATEEPPRIAEICGVEASVDRVFARALSKNEAARFASAAEFGAALAEALELPRSRGAASSATATPVPGAEAGPGRTGALVAGLVLGGLTVFAALRLTEPAAEAPPAAPSAAPSAAPASSGERPARPKRPARARGEGEPPTHEAPAGSAAGADPAGPEPAHADAGAAPVQSARPSGSGLAEEPTPRAEDAGGAGRAP